MYIKHQSNNNAYTQAATYIFLDIRKRKYMYSNFYPKYVQITRSVCTVVVSRHMKVVSKKIFINDLEIISLPMFVIYRFY